MAGYDKEINRIKEKIAKEFKPEKIILFGSHAWGAPAEDSDVDLFIIKQTSQKRIDRSREVRKIIFGSSMPVDIIVYTPAEVKKRKTLEDPFITQILNAGKVLYSHI